MAEESIALTLTLDALGAKEEASSVIETFRKMEKGVTRVAAQMENTFRGRVIKNTIGVFRDNFESLIQNEIPAQLRALAVNPQIAAAIGGAISPQFGQLAAALTRAATPAQGRAAQAAFGALQQVQAQAGGVQLPPDVVASLGRQFVRVELDQSLAREQLARSFSDAVRQGQILPGGQKKIAAVSATQGLKAAQGLLRSAGGIAEAFDPRDSFKGILGIGGGKSE